MFNGMQYGIIVFGKEIVRYVELLCRPVWSGTGSVVRTRFSWYEEWGVELKQG